MTSGLMHELSFDGGILRRGFWLYVWEIIRPQGTALYYVGMTGDSSSTNAQSPFNRMGQHLGFAKTNNTLRKHLLKHEVEPELCRFRLLALGPLEPESRIEARHEHDGRRDRVAAMEKALAEVMKEAGCLVINNVYSNKILNDDRFAQVREAFVRVLPALSRYAGQ